MDIICKPCPLPKQVELVPVEEQCPCPIEEDRKKPFFEAEILVVTEDTNCFEALLKNMTSSKYCSIPPRSCEEFINLTISDLDLPENYITPELESI